jgi:hypothetical protein
MEEIKSKEVKKSQPDSTKMFFLNYIIFGFIFTSVIFLFSVIMAGIASYRNDINETTYENTSKIYNGPITQSAPNLNTLEKESDLYIQNNLTPEIIQKYINNTFLTSTNGSVIITADFVKKGLVYQPSYKTQFQAEYILRNTLNEVSFVTFQFPFPINIDTNEISNAKLIVNGVEITNAKTEIQTITTTYDYYNDSYSNIDGLKWEGKIDPNSETKVVVSYNTVGLSRFTYEGIENSKGAQDFKFEVTINGTRSYDVLEGLSVDSRDFGDKTVKLMWNKPALYSKPLINVEVGDKLNPSVQVSRIYLTMTPIYIVFISILLFLAYKFSKKLGVFDMFLVTLLFIMYFPLIHYLSSFTIDPTIEIFSNIKNVGNFSMPLYAAFGIAGLLIGTMMYYLLGRISGFKFSTMFGIPTMLLFIGFFPLVVTIPEYSMLLVILGTVALLAIIIQVRIKLMK